MSLHRFFVFMVAAASAAILPKSEERAIRKPECEPGYSPLGKNRCIWYTDSKVHWFQARAYCYEKSAFMAEALSYSDQVDLQESVTKTGHKGIWLSGSDMVQNNRWNWYSKKPMNYLHWAINEPSNGENEDCLEMRSGKQYFWNDEPCTSEGRNFGACIRCFNNSTCPSNQMKGKDGCCYCKEEGYTLTRDIDDMCVGQSSYESMFGEPEFLMDGSTFTFMHTKPEKNPYIVANFPSPITLKSVVIQLRTDGPLGEKYCTREHSVEIVVGDSPLKGQVCNIYRGTQRGTLCSGKMKVLKCATPLSGTHITFRMTNPETPLCSSVAFGEVCVEDHVALGGNILNFAEVQLSLV